MNLKTSYFLKEVESINSKLSIFNNSLNLINILIIFLVAVAVNSGYLASLSEQKKHFGLLRALGATKKQIILISQIEALIIALLGFFISVFLSITISNLINQKIQNISELEILLSNSSLILINIKIVTFSLILSVIISNLSALFPVLKVIKKDPSELLK